MCFASLVSGLSVVANVYMCISGFENNLDFFFFTTMDLNIKLEYTNCLVSLVLSFYCALLHLQLLQLSETV